MPKTENIDVSIQPRELTEAETSPAHNQIAGLFYYSSFWPLNRHGVYYCKPQLSRDTGFVNAVSAG